VTALVAILFFSEKSLAQIKYPYAQIRKDTLEIVFEPKQVKELRIEALSLIDCKQYVNRLELVNDTLNGYVVNLNKDLKSQKIIVSNKDKIIDKYKEMSEAQSVVIDKISREQYNQTIINSNLKLDLLKMEMKKNTWRTRTYGILTGVVGFILIKTL
jgi:uncharacterized protein YdbL (DUF1318 family)